LAATRHANDTAARAADRDWVELGRVLRPHGLDGCLLVALHSDDPSNLIAAKELRLTGEMGEIPFRVAGADVLVIRGAGPDLLLPATTDLIVRLDRERGELWLDPPAELVAEASR
jgi:ribosomal 30S subunit maturation factor RimM